MTHTVYPEIVNFVRSEEEKIDQHLRAILEPNGGIVEQGSMDMRNVLNGFKIEGSIEHHLSRFEPPDIDAVKATAGLRLPTLVPFLQYSNRIKTEAFVHAG